MEFSSRDKCKTSVFVVISIYSLVGSVTGNHSHQRADTLTDHYGSGTFLDHIKRFDQMAKHFDQKSHTDNLVFLQPYLQAFLAFLHSNSLETIKLLEQGDILATENSPTVFGVLREMKINEASGMYNDDDDDDQTSSCTTDVMRLLLALVMRESWAISFVDSFGKPGPSITRGWVSFVGNYHQCRESVAPPMREVDSGFTGNYCNLPVRIPVDPFPAIIGICVPSTCSPRQVTTFFRDLLSVANVSSVSFEDVQCLTGETEVTTATIFAIIILCVFGVLVILGTCYDCFLQWDTISTFPVANSKEDEEPRLEATCPNNEQTNEKETSLEKSIVPMPSDEKTPLISKKDSVKPKQSKTRQFFLAFSCYTNGKKLLVSSTSPGSIPAIHGIRFLSISWVALGHVFVYGGTGYTINFATAILSFLQRWTFDAVLNALLSVDTFFTLSGLLTSYTTMKQLWSRGLRINWAKFYFHRFWRLTPPYLCVLVIVLGLQQYLGEGPLWSKIQPQDREYCEKNWWTNALYLNNLINPTEPCFVHSWYLANDMQFFVISPVMLISLYYSKYVGAACCLCLLVASWIVTGVLSAHKVWGVTILSALDHDWFELYYIAPWCRIGPYIVGILAGYFLAATEGKPFRIRPLYAALGWIVAIASALSVLYGIEGHFTAFGEKLEDTNRFVNALYNALGRSVWAGCVSWVIIACTAGYGGPVNVLLSWSPFVVLSRITFMLYLVHLSVINVFFGNMGSMYFMNGTTLAILFLGLFTISCMVSFVGVLLLESPLMALDKIFLRR